MLLNGKPVGEIDVIAAMAGHFGTPVIMLSGDQAAANELREIVPQAEVAVVKEGHRTLYVHQPVGAGGAGSDPRRGPAQRREDRAINPYTVAGPVTLQIEYTTRNSLPPDAEVAPERRGPRRPHHSLSGQRHPRRLACLPALGGSAAAESPGPVARSSHSHGAGVAASNPVARTAPFGSAKGVSVAIRT